MLHISYGGVTRDYDETRLTVPEARLIKARTGCNPPQFWQAIAEMDADAMLTLWAVASIRDGQPFDIDAEADQFNILGLDVDVDEPEDDDQTPTTPGDQPG